VFDHVTLRVLDLAAAERRFQSLLDQLAFDETHSTRAIAAWGDFALAQAEADRPATRRAHIGFAARTREAVDAFWMAGQEAGLTGEPPGTRPAHGADAYAATVRDEQENAFDALHRPARRPDANVAHVRLRVADLAAATGFYRVLADVAGLDLDAAEEGATVGGRLTLAAGAATEHLHLAFSGDDEAVRGFFAQAVAAGHRPNGEPGERARHHPGYYAAYVLDPDGNNIEVVDHQDGWGA
jgi:catechol 2,3-dioxygenase-like lactoylglutathione lyase family enzyme